MSFSYNFTLFYVQGDSKFSESEQSVNSFRVTGAPSGLIEAAITGYMSVKMEIEHAQRKKNVTVYKDWSGGNRDMKLFMDTMKFARDGYSFHFSLSAMQWSEGEIIYSVMLTDHWATVKEVPLIENGRLAISFDLPSAKITG